MISAWVTARQPQWPVWAWCRVVRVLCCRWLIEVNASPSLTASSKEDYDLKYGLLEDVLNVVDLENRFDIILTFTTPIIIIINVIYTPVSKVRACSAVCTELQG